MIGLQFLILRAKIRYFLRSGLLKLRMILCQARIICLKRGYLSVNQAKLRSNRVLWSVGINHPVEIVNVLLQSGHTVFQELRILWSNEKEMSHRANYEWRS
jgi:hypothetical protein